MNFKNAKDFLPFVQALADRKTIQRNIASESEPDWVDQDDVMFTYKSEFYRIKPEPRRWWVTIDPFTKTPHGIYTQREHVPCGFRPIEVVEVK